MNKNIKGYVCFVLHAHLPYIHHPESEDSIIIEFPKIGRRES